LIEVPRARRAKFEILFRSFTLRYLRETFGALIAASSDWVLHWPTLFLIKAATDEMTNHSGVICSPSPSRTHHT
jgi:hypothetical protein